MLSTIKNATADYRVFFTLTYPPGYGESGAQAKLDLAALRKRLARIQIGHFDDGIPYASDNRSWSVIWFQEWQSNGRIHFHLCGTHYIDKTWLSQIWFEIVGSDNPNHLAAGTNIKRISNGRAGVARYAAKYMAKAEQKIPPPGWEFVGRFWGIWGDRRSVAASTGLSPRIASIPSVSNILDEFIIEVEEGLLSGALVELPTENVDLDVFRHFQVTNDVVRCRLASLVRRLDWEKARFNLKFGDRKVPPFVWKGLHTRMFHVEHESELMRKPCQ